MAETENTRKMTKLPEMSEEQKQKQQKQQKVLIVLVLLVAVGAALILYRNGIIGGSAGKKPVEQYLKAIASCDFSSYIDAMPQRIAEEYIAECENSGLGSREYMKELYSDYFDEFGDDMSVELDFTDRSRIDSVYLDNFRQSYSELYGEEINISSAFEIDVTARFLGSVSQDDVKLLCYVIKTDGKWKIAGCEYETEEDSDGVGEAI